MKKLMLLLSMCVIVMLSSCSKEDSVKDLDIPTIKSLIRDDLSKTGWIIDRDFMFYNDNPDIKPSTYCNSVVKVIEKHTNGKDPEIKVFDGEFNKYREYREVKWKTFKTTTLSEVSVCMEEGYMYINIEKFE